jgi:hypothetical protein
MLEAGIPVAAATAAPMAAISPSSGAAVRFAEESRLANFTLRIMLIEENAAAPRQTSIGIESSIIPPYTGMLPCFFSGRVSRFPISIESEQESRARVSMGSITSST